MVEPLVYNCSGSSTQRTMAAKHAENKKVLYARKGERTCRIGKARQAGRHSGYYSLPVQELRVGQDGLALTLCAQAKTPPEQKPTVRPSGLRTPFSCAAAAE